MSLPITLSNYAIPFSDCATPIVVYSADGFVMTNISLTGFTRRKCVIREFRVYCEEPSAIIQMAITGHGIQNFYVDLVECQGKFSDLGISANDWITVNKASENIYNFVISSDINVEMVGIGGIGNIQSILLDIPPIQSNGDSLRRIPLSFYTYGYDTTHEVSETGTLYVTASDLASVNTLPHIQYIENLASRIGTSAKVVLHGSNFLPGMKIYISRGNVYLNHNEIVYTVESDKITFSDDGTTASFILLPTMLYIDGMNMDYCGVYDIHIGFNFDPDTVDFNNLGLIRYKYDETNLEAKNNTPVKFTGVGSCFTESDMSLVFDKTDQYGNGILNPGAGKYGKTIYVRIDGDCNDYKYVQVQLKLNKNLNHKFGELYLDGVQLIEGDVVWLSNQLDKSENGLWVVSKRQWYGYKHSSPMSVTTDCYTKQEPAVVDDTYVIDLGTRVIDSVDYVCNDNIPYKYGRRTVGNYKFTSGDLLLLSNQEDGLNGLWQVTCSDWVYLGPLDAHSGTQIDVSRAVISQHNIDFCKCGTTYFIDYYYLNPTCYLNHLRREVKVLCTGASIVPNHADNQVNISDYSIRLGDTDDLVGNRGRTPGDPVKETCIRTEPDFEQKNNIDVVENVQPIPCCAIDHIYDPNCDSWCDLPKFYNIGTDASYSNSNDANGFTIKFWRHEADGWHLYAYIGSGTAMSGMDYYVYHLHTKGAAVEHLVDVNEHSWFTEKGGVLATGDSEIISDECYNTPSGKCENDRVIGERLFINSFALTDDTWDLPYTVIDSNTQEPVTMYSTNLDTDEKLYSQWRIKCTTTILGSRKPSDGDDAPYFTDQRVTCDDMKDAVKTAFATGTPEYPGYIAGMRHVWGFNYYKSVMSKKEFCDEYNKFNNECVYSKLIPAIATDETDSNGNLNEAIATDLITNYGNATGVVVENQSSNQTNETGSGNTVGTGVSNTGVHIDDDTVITLTNIYSLPTSNGVNEDSSRKWLPVTEPLDPSNPDGKRKTVRVPYPEGDYEHSCEFCHGTGYETCGTCAGTGIGEVCPLCGGTGIDPDKPEPTDPCEPFAICPVCNADARFVVNGVYHLPCETCHGQKGVTCSHCHGLGNGVMTVTKNGIVHLRYDDKVLGINEDGLTVKVDGESVKIGEHGLEVNTELSYPFGTLSSNDLKVDDEVIIPNDVSIVGNNITVDETGKIFANSVRIRGFVASMKIVFDIPNYMYNISMLPYTVTAGSSSWDFVVDTTSPVQTFIATTIVTGRTVRDGIWFTIRKNDEDSVEMSVSYTLDVHSF